MARQDPRPPAEHPETAFTKNTISPDKSGSSLSLNNQSPKANSRRRGRPRNQIQVVTTNHLTIQPRRELRKRGPVSIKTDDDPWAKLSKAPSVTPLSPRKAPQAGPSRRSVTPLSPRKAPQAGSSRRSVTPLSPRKVPQAGPSRRTPVIYLSVTLIKLSKHILSRGPKKQPVRRLTNTMKCIGFVPSHIFL